jgi:formamidopyrimidine-DNA glycosylase
MPELAEVAFYARQWAAARGRRVRRVELHANSRVFRGCDAVLLEEGLAGGKLVRAQTHGKQMLFEFSGDHWLGVHLGMTGELCVKVQPFEAGRHDHLVLHCADCALVFSDARQFGRVQFHAGKAPPSSWPAGTPQPMCAAFTPELVSAVLQRHARQPLKALLLDQCHFPGVGNWMADEVMWQLRLHPQTRAGSLDAKLARSLHRTLRKVCAVALETIGVDWSDPPRTWLFHHRWEKGHDCPRCGAGLTRDDVRGRTACWCPVCQPE